MPDADEAWREDVEEEAPKEFLGVKGHMAFFVQGITGSDGEGDAIRIDGDEAVVGDADAVGVVAEVSEEIGGSAKGAFGVDDPGFGVEGVAEGGPCEGVLEVGEMARKVEITLSAGLDERLDEKVLKALTEDLHREEVSRTGWDPPMRIGGEAASGDDAVDMGVMGEVLRPGVQNGSEANISAEVLRVSGDRQQGLRGGMEEQVIEAFLIAENEGAQGIGKRENDMEMGNGKNASEGVLDPLGTFTALAFGAVTIAAGVVRDAAREVARWASIDMRTQTRRAAGAKAKQNLPLAERSPMVRKEGIGVMPDDIRDFQTGTSSVHDQA